ncbi:hypothetical protein [Stigmatella aurantiaca]|nr:hypothetical protein [Stigmatella aurantiaca]ADO71957.1 conserved uncharacterized protein [Stigmatella aurantiaca DW4/3-1]
MLTVMFLSLLLGAAPGDGASSVSPQALDAPPLVDDSPTAWSCTVDTLRAGRECVFEAELTSAAPSQEQASANIRLVQEVARKLCAEASRSPSEEGQGDRTIAAFCERRTLAVAEERCGLAESVLVDAEGRFAPAARACYRALAGVLQEAQMRSTVAKAHEKGTP